MATNVVSSAATKKPLFPKRKVVAPIEVESKKPVMVDEKHTDPEWENLQEPPESQDIEENPMVGLLSSDCHVSLLTPTLGRKRAGGRSGLASYRKALTSSLVNAPSGTFTYAGFTDRVDWLYGIQGWASSSADLWINHAEDFVPVLTNALFRVLATPTASVVAEPRFWIKRARLRVVITNANQLDCLATVYPWFVRNDSTYLNPSTLYNSVDILETTAVAGGGGGILGNSNVLGWTPFQARAITELVKLGKPKKYRIPGGQSIEYNMVDPKPVYLDYKRLGGAYPASQQDAGNAAVRGHTRGCFITFQGSVINDVTTKSEIDQGPGNCNIQTYKTFEWVVSPMPYHFSDVITNPADIVAFSIIQPQTGVVNAAPTKV